MGKIITVSIQKGGCGKTTMTVNLSACFAHLGKKVLVIDLDYQSNATELLNIRSRELKYEKTIGYAIQKKLNFNKIIMKTNIPQVDVLPGSNSLEPV